MYSLSLLKPRLFYMAAIVLATALAACHIPGKSVASNYNNVDQFNY